MAELNASCIICHHLAPLSTMTPVGTQGSYRCADVGDCTGRYHALEGSRG